jgi:fructose-1,6-bisphosphatase
VKPFYLSSEAVLPIKSNRSTYQVKPFYLSSQTVIPIKSNRSTYQVKPFYLSNSAYTAYTSAGGMASDGARRILDIQPAHIHQRVPIHMGSSQDVAEIEKFFAKHDK